MPLIISHRYFYAFEIRFQNFWELAWIDRVLFQVLLMTFDIVNDNSGLISYSQKEIHLDWAVIKQDLDNLLEPNLESDFCRSISCVGIRGLYNVPFDCPESTMKIDVINKRWNYVGVRRSDPNYLVASTHDDDAGHLLSFGDDWRLISK